MNKIPLTCTVEISYPGAVITKNHYKYKGGIHTKPEATAWMEELGWSIKELHLEDWSLPLSITVSGRFKDKRSQPDLVNLQNCTLDAIQEASGINDKHFRWHDGTVEYGEPPVIWLNISEG